MNRISSEISLSNQTDLMIHRENLIEFFIEKYRMTIKFQKFELKTENENILKKIRNNSLYECLTALKTKLIERKEKIEKILIDKRTVKTQKQLNLKNTKIERISINLKPIISSNELMKRVTILEMRLDDFVRRKRSTEPIRLNTVVVNNLIHNGNMFKGNFDY